MAARSSGGLAQPNTISPATELASTSTLYRIGLGFLVRSQHNHLYDGRNEEENLKANGTPGSLPPYGCASAYQVARRRSFTAICCSTWPFFRGKKRPAHKQHELTRSRERAHYTRKAEL
jgi:hypothetical protein